MKHIIVLFLMLTLVPLAAWGQVDMSEEMPVDVTSATSMTYDGVNVWAYDAATQTLTALDPSNGAMVSKTRLDTKGGYIAFDGARILITDNKSKAVKVVNRATGRVEPYIDLKSIPGQRDMYLEPLRSGEIMGITYGNDRLWVACGAGYSSSIYEIDPSGRVVISQRFAPGPTPVALAYHNNDLWVLDKESKALRCLKDTKQLVYNLRVAAGKAPQALLNIKNKLFVAQKGEKKMRGVAKQKLAAVVPAKVDTTTYAPFLTKERKPVRGDRKVAVLISGDTAASGYNEFWIDVVLMYRIMKARGYNEIYVLYADGRDYSCAWDKYKESMTDFAATKSEVVKIFNALANGDSSLGINKLGSGDILCVYTFDHGASDGRLCLWNGGRYSPSEMATAMRNIQCKKKMFFMQQCFSGAFKNEFQSNQMGDTVIITAASGSQYAYRADTEKEYYNGTTYYHGEFNWHFMSALMGETPENDPVNADSNGDNVVSMQEIFNYYVDQNSQPRQTPQYYSNPTDMGQNTTP